VHLTSPQRPATAEHRPQSRRHRCNLNAGTFLETVLLDDGGTPEIPDDDTFIADLGATFGPHGRTDTYSRDFCADLVAFTS
jgi:hypothetical protein